MNAVVIPGFALYNEFKQTMLYIEKLKKDKKRTKGLSFIFVYLIVHWKVKHSFFFFYDRKEQVASPVFDHLHQVYDA